MPRPRRRRNIIKRARRDVCPSVCLSVSRVPRPNSRTDKSRKPKIGRMEAHHTSNSWTYFRLFRGQKVKVKVTRLLNAVIKDPHHRQAPWLPRSKVTVARSRGASDRCWPISQERNVLQTPKFVGRLGWATFLQISVFLERLLTPQAIMRTRLTNAETEMRHIFRMRRPTKFKLGTQMEHEDSYYRQAPWSTNKSRSQGHVVRLTGVGP